MKFILKLIFCGSLIHSPLISLSFAGAGYSSLEESAVTTTQSPSTSLPEGAKAFQEKFCELARSNIVELEEFLTKNPIFVTRPYFPNFLDFLVNNKEFDVLYALKDLSSENSCRLSSSTTAQWIVSMINEVSRNSKDIRQAQNITFIQGWFEFLQTKGIEEGWLYYTEAEWHILKENIQQSNSSLFQRYMPDWDTLGVNLLKEKLKTKTLDSFPEESRFKGGLTHDKIIETIIEYGLPADITTLSNKPETSLLYLTLENLEKYLLSTKNEEILKKFFTKEVYILFSEEKRFRISQYAKKN